MTAPGAAARRKGHDAERLIARWLRDNGWPDAATTRAVLGHDGSRQPGDIAGIPGWCIEVKDVARAAWRDWCAQAARQAAGCGNRWVVIRRDPATKHVGAWPCITGAIPGVRPDNTLHNAHEAHIRACASRRWIQWGVYGACGYADWLLETPEGRGMSLRLPT